MPEGSLSTPELQDALVYHIIPLLPVQALGALASSCRALRGLVYSLEQAWQDTAGRYLPQAARSAAGRDRAELQPALQSHTVAVRNILAGHVTSSVELEGLKLFQKVGPAVFSPDGHKIAIWDLQTPVLRIFEANTGRELNSVALPQSCTGPSKSSKRGGWLEAIHWTPDCRQLVGMRFGGSSLSFFHADACSLMPPHIEMWLPSLVDDHVLSDEPSLSPCGQWAAVHDYHQPTSCTRHIYIIATETAETLLVVPINERVHECLGPEACWSPSTALMAACGSLINVHERIWHSLPECLRQTTSGINLFGNPYPVFSPDGSLMVFRLQSTTRANAVGIMEVASLQVKSQLPGLLFGGFIGSGQKALLITPANLQQLWDLSNSALLCTLQQPMANCMFLSSALPSLAGGSVAVAVQRWAHSAFHFSNQLVIFDAESGVHMATIPLTLFCGHCDHQSTSCIRGQSWHPLMTMLVAQTSQAVPVVMKFV